MEKQQARKSIMMEICRRILEADPETIKLIRKTPMNCYRVIKNISTNTKDPNPLSTTMMAMSHKYPLSADAQKIKKYKVPSEFLSTQNDTHQHGRILVKKEAIDWWVTESPIPNDDIKKVIDILYKQPRLEVSDYFLVDWGKTSIKLGPVHFERRRVKTKDPIIKIPRDQRIQAVSQILMPDHVTHYDQIDSGELDKIKQCINDNIPSKLCLMTQARILLNQMNPAVKMLPCLPGSSTHTAAFRYAVCQSNFYITGIERKVLVKDEEMFHLTNLACSVVAHNYLTTKPEISYYKEAIKKILINGMPILECFQILEASDTSVIRMTKAICEIPLTATSTEMGTHFSPMSGSSRPVIVKNKVGVPFKQYIGNEKISFRRGGMKGHFSHDGPLIISIITNYTDMRGLREAVASIAVYIRYDMTNSKEQTKDSMFYTTYRRVKENPHDFVRCTKIEWFGLSSRLHGKLKPMAGVVSIMAETEFVESVVEGSSITMDGDIRLPSGRLIQLNIDFDKIPLLSPQIQVPETIFTNYLPPVKRLHRKILQYIHFNVKLKRLVASNEFQWDNQCIDILSDESVDKVKFSLTCRSFLKRTIAHPYDDPIFDAQMIAFYYCFSYPDTSMIFQNIAPKMSIQWQSHPINIDLSGEGLVRLKDKKLFVGPYYMESDREDPDIRQCWFGIIQGYKFLNAKISQAPTKSMKELISKRNEIKEGSVFNVYIDNRLYTVARDCNIDRATYDTLNRQLSAFHLSIINQGSMESSLNKRKRLEAFSSSSSIPSSEECNVIDCKRKRSM